MTTGVPEFDVDSWIQGCRSFIVLNADQAALVEERGHFVLAAERRLDLLDGRDHASAWYALGRCLGRRDTSMRFVLGIVTEAERRDSALGERADRIRELMIEGVQAGFSEKIDRHRIDQWAYPHCAVRLDANSVAVTASLPTEDPEAAETWADGIAVKIAKAGFREAVVSGTWAALVIESLEFAGLRARRA